VLYYVNSKRLSLLYQIPLARNSSLKNAADHNKDTFSLARAPKTARAHL